MNLRAADLPLVLLSLSMFTWSVATGVDAVAAAPTHATISTAINMTALHPGQDGVLAVVADVEAGYHAQSNTPSSSDFIAFVVNPSLDPSIDLFPAIYPRGEDVNYPTLGKLNVYTGRVVVFIPFRVHADAAAGALHLTGKMVFQICNDRACFQPQHPTFDVATSIVTTNQSTSPNQPELFATFDPGVFMTALPPPSTQSITSTQAAPTTVPAAASAQSPAAPPVNYTLPLALATALLTGVLFNVMPCVLPVVPLKIMGFYEVSQHDRRKSVALGAVFSAGLIASFGVLALLVVALRVLDWGGLFQKTWFTLIMVSVLITMSFSLFGFFTVNLPTGIYRFTPRHDTYVGNFLFGILTAALSTPCTFGMFVGLLAWALAQPAVIGVALIMTVGVGIALPYFILSAVPEVARNFPRAGPWAEVVKQMMAFMLLATAVYFAQPLFERFVSDPAFWWTMFAVIAAGAVFLVVRSIQLSTTARPRIIAAILAVAIVVPAFWATRRLTLAPYEWQAFSEETLAKAKSSGRPVLVDFTATWCGNCHWVEAYVLHDPRIVAAVREHAVILIKADVTNGDALAKPLLGKLSPAEAIPLTVVYPVRGEEPILLDGIYSVDDLLKAIAGATKK